ncbi:MAG: hypothetical protein E7646_00200 [Ruminococcaceae bacterium]|nr:hypothetical protein [Oscillospiraceae bacterium]
MKPIYDNVTVSADFSKVCGRIKPMHGVGQPPLPAYNTYHHYLTEAGIPFSRLHDVGGWMGGGLYVDIPNIFPNFEADENDEANYDFAFTDLVIKHLIDAKCEPYFRLGVTIENLHAVKAHRIFPPADFEKWARICEHVISHYIDGWANGFNYQITYWEIWNEPDDCFKDRYAAMWKGTPEQYYKLYSTTAKHLKSCFGDRIKVGGYGHCGLYEYVQDKELEGIGKEPERIYEFCIQFLHGFMSHIKKENAPLDFFSWHVYDNCHETTAKDFAIIAEHAKYARRILDKYGYPNAESHLNEWNLFTDGKHRSSPVAAAKTLAFMLLMQNTPTDIMCYYDARIGHSAYGGMFNPDTLYPYRNYYSFCQFNTLYSLGEQYHSQTDNPNVYCCAAAKDKKAALVIANTCEHETICDIKIEGISTDDVMILQIDEENLYTLTGKDLRSLPITLKPYSCTEIRILDMDR